MSARCEMNGCGYRATMEIALYKPLSVVKACDQCFEVLKAQHNVERAFNLVTGNGVQVPDPPIKIEHEDCTPCDVNAF